jgi:hypothetical protein
MLAVAGFGPILRLTFPALAMAVAGWLLANGRRDEYLAASLWLFLLTPGLRRLVDFYSGWSLVNPIMLAPYAAGALSAGPVLKRLGEQRFPYSALFALLFVCVAYGFVLAVICERPFAAAFDVLRWAVPPCICLFIALDANRGLAYQAAVTRTMLLAVILLSAYGVYQYVLLPPWDAYWMIQSDLGSIGEPKPFLVRVFSTMNSPGSFSAYLMAGLLLALPTSGILRMPALVLGGTALLLTLARTSWLSLMVGLGFLVIFGSSVRARFSIVVAMVCLPLIMGAVAQLPEGKDIIGKRLDTLSAMSEDDSLNERESSYRRFFNYGLGENSFGSGLGISGSYQSYLDRRNKNYIDGAIIEIGTALGVFVGGIYLLVILIVSGIACWRSFQSRDAFSASCGAIVAAQTAGLVSSTTTIGEGGMLFWLAAGFCLLPSISRGWSGRSAA